MVEFTIDSLPKSVILPVNALVFRSEGLQVAVVDKHNHIDLRHITMGTDFGKEVQINSGVLPGERIIVNPDDSIYQGECVRVIGLAHRSLI
ncbi:MAG: hypothetical protein Q8R24_02405 [Legionellaceae bacterium]|nr:hypothetical protein [Legionellaceae bacterium]